MSHLTCTNPPCRRAVAVPSTARPGVRYACPHCGQPLPPVPAPDTTMTDLLFAMGLGMMGFGGLVTLLALAMDITNGGVYNVGFMSNRLCWVIVGVGLAVMGTLLVTRPQGKP